MRILPLAIELANQIAAGEVIERPASVVKELLENALDAKANSIHIEIGFGGLNHIKVSDNGLGIVAEDLPLAIAPHATSKIRSLKDLQNIASMGFRGEALASIASIAHIEISSRPASQETGMQLKRYNAEKAPEISPMARNIGTSVEVKDIFFNAPVRKKFLKSERLEFQAIENIVKRFALSAPHISLELKHNGKMLLQLPRAKDETSRQLRLAKIFGKAFIDSAYTIDYAQSEMHLQGWCSGLDFQRSQNDKLWVYLNGRMVRDKLLMHAIKQAYEGHLYPGRHPACILYLSMPPELVDVNVHPTKHEVRFQEPRMIHDFITLALSQALGSEGTGLTETYMQPSRWTEVQEEPARTMYQAKNYFKSYINAPVRVEPAPKEFLETILHKNYGIVLLSGLPYLLSLKGLHKDYLFHLIKGASKPLAKRPLLVPLVVLIPDTLETPFLDNLQKKLLQLGIVIEQTQASEWTIRSLPLLVPHLNVCDFVRACFKLASLDEQPMLLLLVENETGELDPLDQEAQALYAQYLQNLLKEADEPRPNFIKALSEKNCQDFLDVS